jgi:hypothetical protein
MIVLWFKKILYFVTSFVLKVRSSVSSKTLVAMLKDDKKHLPYLFS